MIALSEALPEGSAGDQINWWYQPVPPIRVGILLLGDALQGCDKSVDDALTKAGYRPQRRKARLQTRPGEPRLRVDDVLQFAELFGHEYSVAIVRSWPDAAGSEGAIVTALRNAGCAVLWEVTPEDELHDVLAIEGSGAEALIVRH